MKLYICNCHSNATVSISILTYVLQTPTTSVDATAVAPPSLHPLMNARSQVCFIPIVTSCIVIIYRFRLHLLRLHLLGLHLLRLRLPRLVLLGLPVPSSLRLPRLRLPSLRLLSLPTHSLPPPSHLLARLLPPLLPCAIAPLQRHNYHQQQHRPCLRRKACSIASGHPSGVS